MKSPRALQKAFAVALAASGAALGSAVGTTLIILSMHSARADGAYGFSNFDGHAAAAPTKRVAMNSTRPPLRRAPAGTTAAAISRRPAQITEDEPQTEEHRSIAQDEPKISVETTSRDLTDDAPPSGTALTLYLGAGGGGMKLSSNDRANEPSKQGPSLMGKASLSLSNDQGLLDLGVGWMQTELSGATQITGASSVTHTSADVQTRVGLVEFSPRLKFKNHYEVGPLAAALFGADASFSQTRSGFSSPVFAGLKAAADFDAGKVHVRFTAQAMASLTLQDRQVYMGAALVEIGIPLLSGKTVIRETQVNTIRHEVEHELVERQTRYTRRIAQEVPVEVVKEVPVYKEVVKVKEVVRFSFDEQVVHFEFDRAKITPSSRDFIEQLGNYLAEHSQTFSRVRVEGHTDGRGTVDYNQKLSEARAQSVAQAFAKLGVDSQKLSAQGFGQGRPVSPGDDDIARARNRRVELAFEGVTDGEGLREAINRIKLATSRPETCDARGNCR